MAATRRGASGHRTPREILREALTLGGRQERVAIALTANDAVTGQRLLARRYVGIRRWTSPYPAQA